MIPLAIITSRIADEMVNTPQPRDQTLTLDVGNKNNKSPSDVMTCRELGSFHDFLLNFSPSNIALSRQSIISSERKYKVGHSLQYNAQ